MRDIFRFPRGGYEVKVVRKQDILDCIDENILDKDVALELVKTCEVDAANYLRQGKWVGIPFMGNIRIPKTVQILKSPESKKLLEEAKATLEPNKYVLFRRGYSNQIGKQVKIERYYRYAVSIFVGRNQKFFRVVSEKHGDVYARFLCYTLRDLEVVDSSL